MGKETKENVLSYSAWKWSVSVQRSKEQVKVKQGGQERTNIFRQVNYYPGVSACRNWMVAKVGAPEVLQ